MRDSDGSVTEHEDNARIVLLVSGVIMGALGGFAGGLATGDKVAEIEQGRQRLRNILKDPKKTDQLIEKLKGQSFTRDLLDDPEVSKNLRRLTAAVMGHAEETL